MLLVAGGAVLDANPEACRILRRTREELASASFDAFFDATDPRLEPALAELRRAGRFEGELRLPRGDGTTFPAEVAISNLQEEVGECLGVFFRDITGRERIEAALRESEERFRLTFELAAVGMAHVGPDGRWLRINDKLLEIVGYSREELLSLTFQDITHPEDLDADLRHAHQLLAGHIQTYSTEKRYIKKDRSRVWVELTVSLVRGSSGEPEYFISIIEDITQRKLKEFVPDPLTPREFEVLGLVAQRKTNPEIAEDLAHSLGTIKLDVRRVAAKLEAPDRRQAAARAMEIGLIPPR